MWLDCLFAWPDQLPALAQVAPFSLDAIAIQLRLQNHLDAEHRLLAASANPGADDLPAIAFMQAYLALVRDDFSRAEELIQRGCLLGCDFQPAWNAFLSTQLALKRLDTQALPHSGDSIWSLSSEWQPLMITQAAVALARSDLAECQRLLSGIDHPP